MEHLLEMYGLINKRNYRQFQLIVNKLIIDFLNNFIIIKMNPT